MNACGAVEKLDISLRIGVLPDYAIKSGATDTFRDKAGLYPFNSVFTRHNYISWPLPAVTTGPV
jgi:hypothetical protein